MNDLREKLAALLVAYQAARSGPWGERLARTEQAAALALALLGALVDRIEQLERRVKK